MATTFQNKVVVLGGGISGLTATRTARELGHECLLLERCPSFGGLTRTVEVGDFSFDYTGHLLHLSRYKTPAEIPYASLNNENWRRIRRQSRCFIAGKMVAAPIQYNLSQLPREILDRCIESYQTRPALKNSTCPTFRDYIVSGFGQYLADLFLIPQNEKTMAISLDRLSVRAVKRFFPPPTEALVLAGIRGETSPSAEYNSTFWYPKSGGIGALVKGLGSGLANVSVNKQVAAVDLRTKKLRTTTGESFRWDYLFSSMPLKSFCQITNDKDLVAAAEELTHSSTIVFNIGLSEPLGHKFERVHWIYVPDRSVPFYRVGFYSNISEGSCSPGNSSLYAEVGVPSEELPNVDLVKDLERRVIASLEHMGCLKSRAVACVVIHIIQCAYVHHTERRESIVEDVMARLHEFGVYPVGRYGLWDYTSMEDSMESARTTVREVLGGV